MLVQHEQFEQTLEVLDAAGAVADELFFEKVSALREVAPSVRMRGCGVLGGD